MKHKTMAYAIMSFFIGLKMQSVQSNLDKKLELYRAGFRRSPYPVKWQNRSKYAPHQGKQECARRVRQASA